MGQEPDIGEAVPYETVNPAPERKSDLARPPQNPILCSRYVPPSSFSFLGSMPYRALLT